MSVTEDPISSPDVGMGDKKAERLSLRKRKLIKHVADIVWNTLTKSQYKDRPHLHSIYSYLTGWFYAISD